MNELLEVVDIEDRVIGIEKRGTIHSLGLWHRVSHVFVYDKNGRILLQMRSPDVSNYPSRWDCSCSEHVKPQESWENAAQRGLKEELGISGVSLKEVLYCRANYIQEAKVISKLFVCSTNKIPIINKKEVYTYRFFDESEIKNMLIRGSNRFAMWSEQQLRWMFGMPSALCNLK